MRFLRTASTRRLLGVIAVLVVAIVAGSAIAIAASGPGPKPAPKPLPQAIHSALIAPAPAGITARVKFTNNLISSSEIQSPGPLLGGGNGRVWLSPATHQLRLELQGENGDAQLLVNQRSFWVYDPMSNTVYEGTLPAQQQSANSGAQDKVPSVAQIQSQLQQAMAHVTLSGAIPSDVAGRAAYTLKVSPQHSGGLLGSAQLAWDALRGVPLRFALYASNQPKPVLELKATHISFGRVKSKVFSISPPAGAKVVRIAKTTQAQPKQSKRHQEVTGVRNVSKHLSFSLAAPAKLVGLPRQSVSLLDWKGAPAALVSYGQNLGGIAVIEQKAQGKAQAAASSKGGDQQGLTLPTVSIRGASGTELDTAIGTVVQFTRGGVSYTVIGSVPPAAAEAAARAL
jgi:outer membrane lipoprotein-sorting protein